MAIVFGGTGQGGFGCKFIASSSVIGAETYSPVQGDSFDTSSIYYTLPSYYRELMGNTEIFSNIWSGLGLVFSSDIFKLWQLTYHGSSSEIPRYFQRKWQNLKFKKTLDTTATLSAKGTGKIDFRDAEYLDISVTTTSGVDFLGDIYTDTLTHEGALKWSFDVTFPSTTPDPSNTSERYRSIYFGYTDTGGATGSNTSLSNITKNAVGVGIYERRLSAVHIDSTGRVSFDYAPYFLSVDKKYTFIAEYNPTGFLNCAVYETDKQLFTSVGGSADADEPFTDTLFEQTATLQAAGFTPTTSHEVRYTLVSSIGTKVLSAKIIEVTALLNGLTRIRLSAKIIPNFDSGIDYAIVGLSSSPETELKFDIVGLAVDYKFSVQSFGAFSISAPLTRISPNTLLGIPNLQSELSPGDHPARIHTWEYMWPVLPEKGKYIPTMRPTISRSGTYTVTVRDSALAVVPSANVDVYKEDQTTLLQQLICDSNGQVTVTIDEGKYYIKKYKLGVVIDTPNEAITAYATGSLLQYNDYDISGKVINFVVPQMGDMIAEFIAYDEGDLYSNFGYILGLPDEDSSEYYRDKVQALLHCRFSGPTIQSVRSGVGLFLGLPVSPETGTVTAINNHYSATEGQIVIESGTVPNLKYSTVYFPKRSGINVSVNDSVSQFQILTDTVKVEDYISSPYWMFDSISHYQGNTPVHYTDMGKYHTFLVDIDLMKVDISNIYPAAKFVNDVKPTFKNAIVRGSIDLLDTEDIEDHIIFTIFTYLYDDMCDLDNPRYDSQLTMTSTDYDFMYDQGYADWQPNAGYTDFSHDGVGAQLVTSSELYTRTLLYKGGSSNYFGTATTGLEIGKRTLTGSNGDFAGLKPGDYIELDGLANSSDNGTFKITKTVSNGSYVELTRTFTATEANVPWKGFRDSPFLSGYVTVDSANNATDSYANGNLAVEVAYAINGNTTLPMQSLSDVYFILRERFSGSNASMTQYDNTIQGSTNDFNGLEVGDSIFLDNPSQYSGLANHLDGGRHEIVAIDTANKSYVVVDQTFSQDYSNIDWTGVSQGGTIVQVDEIDAGQITWKTALSPALSFYKNKDYFVTIASLAHIGAYYDEWDELCPDETLGIKITIGSSDATRPGSDPDGTSIFFTGSAAQLAYNPNDTITADALVTDFPSQPSGSQDVYLVPENVPT